MKKKVLIWEIIGFLTVCALSGVFHFIYDWSGKQAWIGFFCPVNESTWEHLKLLFFPVLIFSAIEYIWIRKESKNFIAARSHRHSIGNVYNYSGILYVYGNIRKPLYVAGSCDIFYWSTCNIFVYQLWYETLQRKNF